MPANDVTVTGSFTVNTYKLTYVVDGKEYKSYDVEFAAGITPEAEPAKEGYIFSGWSEIPETMPAHDVAVTGTFTANSNKELIWNGDLTNDEATEHYFRTNGMETEMLSKGIQVIVKRNADGSLSVRKVLVR